MPRHLRPRHPTTGRAFRPELGRFGNFPRELRDQIYSDLYGGWRITIIAASNPDSIPTPYPYRDGSVEDIRSTFVNDDGSSTRPRPKAIVGSLLVSRRFSEEVANTLLSTNRFIFEGPGALTTFLDSIAEGHRHRITKVHLDCDHLEPYDWIRYRWDRIMRALERLHGIKYLTVSLTMEKHPIYHESDDVRDRVVEVGESKLFPKLELAIIECYCQEDEFQLIDVRLERLQRFLMGDLKLWVG